MITKFGIVYSSVLISAAPAGLFPLPGVSPPLLTPDVASFAVLSCSAAWVHTQSKYEFSYHYIYLSSKRKMITMCFHNCVWGLPSVVSYYIWIVKHFCINKHPVNIFIRNKCGYQHFNHNKVQHKSNTNCNTIGCSDTRHWRLVLG